MNQKGILCVLLFVCFLTGIPISGIASSDGVQEVSIRIPCTVRVDVGTNGQVQVKEAVYRNTTGSFEVQPGTRVDFVIAPDQGCQVSVLTLSGTDVRGQLNDGVYSVTINRNEELVARFSKGDPTPDPSPSLSPSPSSNPSQNPSSNSSSGKPPGNDPSSTQNTKNTPRTGDDSPLYSYVVLMVISFVTLMGLVWSINRKRKHKSD